MDPYRKIINDAITSLSFEQKIVFCLLTSEKLLPNYEFFSKKYNYGNPDLLKNTIETLYTNLADVKSLGSELDKMLENIDRITPDMDDFSSVLASSALDACTSLLSTLYFIKDGDEENVIAVATYARDTVDMYIFEKENLDPQNKNYEMIIEQDPYMVNEKKRQMSIASSLRNTNLINSNIVDELRVLNRKEPIIDLSLLP